MKDKPLVSICIPTKNRCSALGKSLESLVSQPEFKTGRVEIIISDNASSDDTEELSQRFAKEYSNVRYFRNQEDVLGYNFPLAVSRGTGELRKLCNDSIIYTNDALEIFCEAVEKYRDSKPILFFETENTDDGNIYTYYDDFSGFVRATGYNLTWIGSFSIWEDDIEMFSPISEDGVARYFLQVLTILEIMRKKHSAVTVRKRFADIIQPIVRNYGTNLVDIFHDRFVDALRRFQNTGELSDKDIEYVREILLYRFFRHHLLFINADGMPRNCDPGEEDKVFNRYKDAPYFEKFLRELKNDKRDISVAIDDMLLFCSNCSTLYLYGTGSGAKILTDMLVKKGVCIRGYIVSPGHKAYDEFCDKPVFTADQRLDYYEHTGILITTGSKIGKDIVSVLNHYGYENNIFCQRLMDYYFIG